MEKVELLLRLVLYALVAHLLWEVSDYFGGAYVPTSQNEQFLESVPVHKDGFSTAQAQCQRSTDAWRHSVVAAT